MSSGSALAGPRLAKSRHAADRHRRASARDPGAAAGDACWRSRPVAAVALLCRPGFEPEAIADWRALGLPGAASIVAAGLVRAELSPRPLGELAARLPPWRDGLPFVRDLLPVLGQVPLPRGGRVEVLARTLAELGSPPAELLAADSEAGRVLAPMLARVGRRLPVASGGQAGERCRVLFLASELAWLTASVPGISAPWPGGVPRLKLPPGAPSRSALKLEEALLTLFGPGEALRPGQRAVDLGAAPGGWSLLLRQRGLAVLAVDHATLAPQVLAAGVAHRRADAFRFRVERPVDWLFCDMVAPPRRVASLIGQWLGRGDARRALFNLKLPEGDRHRELDRALASLQTASGPLARLCCRQLYHDRDEVTVLALTEA